MIWSALIQGAGLVLAIVSTNCPYGPTEVLGGGRWGTLVPVGNTAALAQAMRALLRNPGDENARQARAAHFTIARAVDAYTALMLAR
jgi:glycosyltransferase involved in cell wall biosynthesis